MTPTEAAELLGIRPSASEPERRAAFDRQRQALEQKIAQVPTPGLKEKYRQGLTKLEAAYEALEAAADGGDLPVLRPVANAASPASASPVVPTPPASKTSAVRSHTRDLVIGVLLLLAVVGAAAGWWWQQEVKHDATRDAALTSISSLPDSASASQEAQVSQVVSDYDRTATGSRKDAVAQAWSQKRGALRLSRVASLLAQIQALPADAPAERFTALQTQLTEFQRQGVDDARLGQALGERQADRQARAEAERQRQEEAAKALADKQAAAEVARKKREADLTRRLIALSSALDAGREVRQRAETQARDFKSEEGNRETPADVKDYLIRRRTSWDAYVTWLSEDPTASNLKTALDTARELKTSNPEGAEAALAKADQLVSTWTTARATAWRDRYAAPLVTWCWEQSVIAGNQSPLRRARTDVPGFAELIAPLISLLKAKLSVLNDAAPFPDNVVSWLRVLGEAAPTDGDLPRWQQKVSDVTALRTTCAVFAQDSGFVGDAERTALGTLAKLVGDQDAQVAAAQAKLAELSALSQRQSTLNADQPLAAATALDGLTRDLSRWEALLDANTKSGDQWLDAHAVLSGFDASKPDLARIKAALAVARSVKGDADPEVKRWIDAYGWMPPWASAVGKDQSGVWADLTIQGVVQRFRFIKPGKFVMGSPQEEKDQAVRERAKPEWVAPEVQHAVTLTRAYWLADSECTQGLWQSVMGTNPSNFKGAQLPVEQVSWDDTQQFVQRLNTQVSGLGSRLPTEAEWEYACRAGTTTPFAGASPEVLGWYFAHAGGTTHAVRGKQVNAWGLYDMHGNVLEWCADWFGDYPGGAVMDPSGPASGSIRVNRGGSWLDGPGFCRSASRDRGAPGRRLSLLGFRVLIEAR